MLFINNMSQNNKITEALNTITDDISFIFDINVKTNLFTEFDEARTKIYGIIHKINEEKEKQKQDKYIDVPIVTVTAKLEGTNIVIQKSEFTKNLSSISDNYIYTKQMFDDFIYIYACLMSKSFIFLEGQCISISVDVKNVLFGQYRINHFSVILEQNTIPEK